MTMRRSEREITDPAAMDDVLSRATVCHLGLCDDGQPYVVPLNYGYEDRTLYFHSSTEGQKIEILRSNNRVCFQVDTDVEIVVGGSGCNCRTKYRSVIGFGRAAFIEDPAEKRRALAVLMRHYASGPFVFPDDAVAKTCVFRVDIERMTGKQA